MRIVESVRALQSRADLERAAGRRIALVPTMGALHAGHLSLVDAARKHADCVWVSIFVNPAQFDEAVDFERYPSDRDGDLAKCREAGVDLVFAPTVEEMDPLGAQTAVEVSELAKPLCGASRPGHFRGVATVVSKLLHAAKPHVAVFGEKDFQQLAVIRRMVHDLAFDVDVISGPIVREPDGLALSSRNVRLGPQARQQARALVCALDVAESAVAAGERSRDALLQLVSAEIARADRATLDYAELRDPGSLELAPELLAGDTLLALAAHFRPDDDGRGADTRLIDNRVLHPKSTVPLPT